MKDSMPLANIVVGINSELETHCGDPDRKQLSP